MKQLRVLLLFCSLILWMGAANSVSIAEANGETGGQVSINGKISFYEDSLESSNSTNTELSTEPTNSTKPSQHFPSTGELVSHYRLIGGGLLLICLLFLRMRSKGAQK